MSKKPADPAVAAFMAQVMAGMRVKTAGELIDRMLEAGAVKRSQTRKINRWVAGESAPDHESTLWLLREARLLRKRPGAAEVDVVRLSHPDDDHLGGIAAALDQIGRSQELLLEHLELSLDEDTSLEATP